MTVALPVRTLSPGLAYGRSRIAAFYGYLFFSPFPRLDRSRENYTSQKPFLAVGEGRGELAFTDGWKVTRNTFIKPQRPARLSWPLPSESFQAFWLSTSPKRVLLQA